MKAIERFISNQISDGFSKEEVNEYLNKCSSILKKQVTGYPFSSDKDVAEKIALEWDIKKSDAAEIVAELRAGNGTEEETATPAPVVLVIEKTWHKAGDIFGMTYDQCMYIDDLAARNAELIGGWDFRSTTNARRCVTKKDASDIIDALKNGRKVIVK